MIKTKNILTQLMVVGLLATFGFAGAMQGVQTNYNDYNSIKGKLDAYQAENEAFFNPGNYVTSEESDGNKKKIKYTKKEEEWQFADIPQDNTTLGQLLDALEKKKKKYGYLNPYSYVLKSEVPSVSFYISMLLVRIAIVNNIPPATIDDHTEKIVEYVKNVTPTQLQLLMESVLDQIRRLGTKERDKAIALATTVANNTDSALGALASLVKDGKIPSVQEAEEAIEKIK
ncbi:MAG: hypothetical protein LBT90_01565, partial [Holosporaceae bacterium]|nr:hypothetical protein [Holosporaceae bacterium]